MRLPNWVGDFVMAEPLVRALHDRWHAAGGAAELAFAGPARCLALIEARVPASELIGIEAGAEGELYRGRDAVLLLDGSWRSAALACAARVPVRVGWARGGRGVLLTHAVVPARETGGVPVALGRAGRFPRWLPRPFGAACNELASLLGVAVQDTRPALAASRAARERARARRARGGLAPGAPFVLLNAGARAGTAKAPPPELWGSAIAGLRARGHAVRVVCAPGEEAAARLAVRFAAQVAGPVDARLAGRTSGADDGRGLLWDDPPPDLDELLAHCAAAALVVTADSGPRHVALAAGAPLVVVCGPTDPRHTADHLERTRIVRVRVPCGPCHEELCPLVGPGRHACLREIDPREILAAAEDLLR